jgi:hypothetical protein
MTNAKFWLTDSLKMSPADRSTRALLPGATEDEHLVLEGRAGLGSRPRGNIHV